MDGRTDGHMEIHPCVLQDIGPLGSLLKKEVRARMTTLTTVKTTVAESAITALSKIETATKKENSCDSIIII